MRFIALLLLSFTLTQPVTAYWQQKVDHKISVSLDDKNHILRGYQEMIYTNNSPDTLRYIFMHLYPNAYKHDHTAFSKQKVADGDTKFYYSDKYDKGFIDSLSFASNNLPLNYSKYNDNEDIIFLELVDPLFPGQSIEINTPFRVVIPKTFSRLGHIGQSYQITQWYPKPAVYDKDGWHMMPYLDQGEFYYEYGDYQVTISLPSSYIVASTGDLQTKDEITRINTLAGEAVDPVDAVNSLNGPNKTIRFAQKNVHDFAWFADKTFKVKKEVFELPSGKSCTAYAYYTPANEKKYTNAAKVLAETTKFLSKEVGEYPYNQISIVDGPLYAGGGMEYPNIAIIGNLPDQSTVNIVIVHEAGHNWFQGLLGSNERVHPWLDEGVNSFYEAKVVAELKRQKIPIAKSGGNSIIYVLNGHSRRDQPIGLPAEQFTNENYGGVVYAKTAKALAHLEDYIGVSNFNKGIREYFKTWKQKHPAPEDLYSALNNHTDKNLDWFFKGLINSGGPIDYRIKSAKKKGAQTEIKVSDRFGSSYPVPVFVIQGDSVLQKKYTENGMVIFNDFGESVKYKIDNENVIPEINSRNNIYRASGLFKRAKPKLGIGTSVLTPGINKAFLMPTVGFNHYDRSMLGLALHNIKVPNSQFQFALNPMYSFGAKRFNGTGVIGYTFYPKNSFKQVIASVRGGSFSADSTIRFLNEAIYPRWYKVNPRIRFDLAKSSLRSPVERSIVLNFFHTATQGYNFFRDTIRDISIPSLGSYNKRNLFRLNYNHFNNRTFNPFNYQFQYETTDQISKLTAEANLKIDYFMPDKALYFRVFAGKFLYLDNEASFFDEAPYFLNVTPTAVNDYVYENTFLGRNEREGYKGQQVLDREGGFASRSSFLASPLGRTDDWLASVNIRTDIPVKYKFLPQVFFNVATFANAGQLNSSGNNTLYEGGLQFNILKDIIRIKVPLVLSKDFKDYTQSIYTVNRFTRQISFSLATDRIDLLRTQEEITKILY